ncbi:pyruvate kinase [Sulfurospirillum multivorans]|uniref:Pyruvate kinase n=2 Tax=Sulfurospirillum multivorans TaxID=66821 RepID=A0AA86ALD1_SULMK|nr:pyruvate kinase [Sulfurospirillum multivorans]AHJ11942.1 pyruvate kinase [Sulfurospirillum multivorans DSM 12446]QEH05447.1 pyruvate kinase [Sulfurospirillum multivorans]
MDKKTKILATVGPASDSVEILEGLIRAGVNVFRLNFSHGTHEYHASTLAKIREAEKNVQKKVGVLQDICGPKIRVGKLEDDFYLEPGDHIHFTKEQIVGKKLEEGKYELCINQPQILDMLKEGEYIYLYDGNIRAKVIEIGDKIVTQVENSGKLSSNKGVNFPNTVINIEVITPKDEADLRWGAENDVDFVAVSFVQSAKDILQARKILKEHKSRAHIFAKIEKFDAVEKIDEILEVSDGIMVARGDLGIEVPYYKVPSIQKRLIAKANAASKPVITATQMLLSMAEKEMATRAEISDVANAVLDGTDAVMLSEESAIGVNPIHVVEVMSNTIKEIEAIYPYSKFEVYPFLDETDIISSSTARLADRLGVEAMISLTSSGKSAKKLARYRIKADIYAVTHDERVARSLTIAWGIKPIMNIEASNLNMMLGKTLQKGIERGLIDKEKTYIVTAGYPAGVEGSTNFIRILKKAQIEYYTDMVL